MRAVSPSPFDSLPLLPLRSSCLQAVKGKWVSITRWSPVEATGLRIVWSFHFVHFEFEYITSSAHQLGVTRKYTHLKYVMFLTMSKVMHKHHSSPKTTTWACMSPCLNADISRMWQTQGHICYLLFNMNNMNWILKCAKSLNRAWLQLMVCQVKLNLPCCNRCATTLQVCTVFVVHSLCLD